VVFASVTAEISNSAIASEIASSTATAASASSTPAAIGGDLHSDLGAHEIGPVHHADSGLGVSEVFKLQKSKPGGVERHPGAGESAVLGELHLEVFFLNILEDVANIDTVVGLRIPVSVPLVRFIVRCHFRKLQHKPAKAGLISYRNSQAVISLALASGRCRYY